MTEYAPASGPAVWPRSGLSCLTWCTLEPHWGVPFSLCDKVWYEVMYKMWHCKPQREQMVHRSYMHWLA